MTHLTQPQMKDMTTRSSTSCDNLVGSSNRKAIDILPNLPGALRILYKNMMKKTSEYTIHALVDPIVCGLEHHQIFVGQEDADQFSHMREIGATLIIFYIE